VIAEFCGFLYKKLPSGFQNWLCQFSFLPEMGEKKIAPHSHMQFIFSVYYVFICLYCTHHKLLLGLSISLYLIFHSHHKTVTYL
jgi:hypothetical protein